MNAGSNKQIVADTNRSSGIQPQNRFDALDFYRYGGALFVAIVHYLFYLPVDRTLVTYIDKQLQPLMGFFFTLSGFVIMHVYQGISTRHDYLDYLQKRLARMYPLHAVMLMIFILCPFFGILERWFSPLAIFTNLLLVHAWGINHHLTFNFPSWSVSAEMFVYLLFPAFLFVINRVGLWTALLIACLAAVANTLFFETLGLRPWTHATYDFGCLRAVPSFIAGMAIYRFATVRFSGLVVPAWVAHGSAVATIPLMLAGALNQLSLAVMVVVVFLLARAEPRAPGLCSTPLFRSLANCSYGFYMLHVVVGEFVLGQAPKLFHLDQSILKFCLVPVALIATTLVAVLSFRFFENPARRFLGDLHLGPYRASAQVSLSHLSPLAPHGAVQNARPAATSGAPRSRRV